MRKFEYEIHDLGINYPDYFQGFSDGDYMYGVYGIGDTYNDALYDAVEQVASTLFMEGYDSRFVTMHCDAIEANMLCDDENDKTAVDENIEYVDSEIPFYHVGIRFNVVRDKEGALV